MRSETQRALISLCTTFRKKVSDPHSQIFWFNKNAHGPSNLNFYKILPDHCDGRTHNEKHGHGAWICCVPGSPAAALRERVSSLELPHKLMSLPTACCQYTKAALMSHRAQCAGPWGDKASKGILMDCVSPNLEALSHPGVLCSSPFCDLLALPFVGVKLTPHSNQGP